jgi:hypothetical protein
MLSPTFESMSAQNLLARDVLFPFLGFLSLAPQDAGVRRFDQVESASRAAGFRPEKSSPDEWQSDDERGYSEL